MRMRKTVRVKKHARKSSRIAAIGAGIIVLVVTGVVGAAMLIARQPSDPLEMTSADVRPERTPAAGQPRKTVTARASAAEAVMASTLATDATVVNTSADASAAKATS